MTPLVVLLLALSLASAHHTPVRQRCISAPCNYPYPTLDVDDVGFLQDYGGGPRSRREAVEDLGDARTLASLLEGLAPVAAATSNLLAGVASLGFAAGAVGNPYYNNPWYGGYGGGYAPGYGYGYPYRPFPYAH